MSSTTTLGFPFAQSADRVADMATAQQTLAQFVDDNVGLVKSGISSVNVVAINTDAALAVVFATAFPAAGPVPTVIAGFQNIANPGNVSPVTVSGITRAGFTLNVRRSVGTGATSVGWIASAI